MKRFKYLALAALVAFGACDEGADISVEPDPITGTITASVMAEGSGVEGVTVNLVGPTSASQTTPASGMVTFSNVGEGAYAVTISGIPSGYVCTNTSQTVTINTDGQTQPASFTCNVVRSASISGQVTAGGTGVEGATIEITGPDGTEQTQSGVSGNYQFTGLIAGDYTVTLQEADLSGIECAETTVNRALEPGESEVANFSCGGQLEPASVAIERITTQGGAAVDRSMVSGIIVIQVGVDQGGQNVTEVNVDVNGVEVCSQELGSLLVAGGPMAQDEEFEIDCVVNTAAVRNIDGEPTSQFSEAGDGLPFEPIFLNGEINITAEAITEDDEDDDPTATAGVTFVNADVLALNVQNDNPEAPDFIIDSSDGLRWLSGSLTFTVYPIIYSAPFDANNPTIARANFGFDSYVSTETTASFTNEGASRPLVGADATPASWQLSDITPDPTDGSFTFSLPDTHTGGTMSGGVLVIGNSGGVDDLITGDIGAQNITISTVTSFGQFGPGVTCANISTTCTPTAGTVSPNPLRIFYEGVLQSGTGAVNNVLRVDNQEPWANTIRLNPHPLETAFPVPSAAITNNGANAVRGGFNFNSLRDGWLNHEYAFNSSMWMSTGSTDSPNFYATHPNFTLPTNVTASVTPLMGIGVDATSLAFFAMESESSNSPSAFSVSGMAVGTEAQRVRNADGMMVETGADYPHDEGPGLDDPSLTPPNSNEADDVSLVAIVADLFANAGVTNVIETGVDSNQPIFRATGGASGTSPLYPTPVGTVYNTYGEYQASNPSNEGDATLDCTWFATAYEVCTTDKLPGVFEGSITDAGQGFSGAAGVWIDDYELGCASGVTACAGTARNNRTGVDLQPFMGGGGYLNWEWSVAASTFSTPMGAAIAAYDAALMAPATNDGYRRQMVYAYDRAANLNDDLAPTVEHIADKTRPLVGNVEMPTVTMFTLGNSYMYRGENEDRVDLKYTDFVIDFNTITTVQAYADEIGNSGDPFAPDVDAYGNPYYGEDGFAFGTANNSLQLPMAETNHTAFGSASILLASNLEVSAEFVGCIALFDDGGAPDGAFGGRRALSSDPTTVHIPRGPRWRTWDHAYPYGLINTQYNTFTPSSVPQNNQTTCANGMSAAGIRSQISPSAGAGRWDFGIGVETGGSQLELSVNGQAGSFVPSFDITQVDLYYIDAEGRARILDLSGNNWTGPFVEDIGNGPNDRIYTWTWNGTLPANTLVPTVGARWTEPYFFTVRFENGTAIMWDDSANP